MNICPEIFEFDGGTLMACTPFPVIDTPLRPLALALSPDHTGVLYYKGYVLYKLSHSTLARGRAIEAKGVVPDFLADARACLTRALALQADHGPARELLRDVEGARSSWSES